MNILRHFNFKGKNRLIKWLGLSTGLDRIVPWGKKSLIKVNNTELIGFDIFWNGGYENDIHWCLDNIINENSVCVDIGANIGVYTILLAEISKTVHAVEPNSNFRDLLNSNIRLNNFNNIKVYDSGISKNGGGEILSLFCPPDHMKNKSATTKDINNDLTEKVNINCLTLDELCFDFDKVDFIKIDCDGADADIILSGKSTISTKKPIILFEDMGLDYDFNSDIFLAYKDAYSFLINHEYHLFKVEDRSFVRTSNQQIKNQYANIIALPQ